MECRLPFEYRYQPFAASSRRAKKKASRMRINRPVDKLQLAKLSQDDRCVWSFRFQEERAGASHEEFGRVLPGNTPKATAMMSEILVVRSNL